MSASMRKIVLLPLLLFPALAFAQVDCSKLTRTVDEFTGTKKSYSINTKKLTAALTMLVYSRNETKEGDVIHLLRAALQGDYGIMDNPKIELLMGNGQTMTLTANAQADVGNGILRGMYLHTVTVVLTDEEVETLKNVAVTKLRLGGSLSDTVPPKVANNFISGIRCASEPLEGGN